MPNLIRALAIRCFATWRLAAETMLVLGSFGLLLYLLPGAVVSVFSYLYVLVTLTCYYTVVGLLYFILPGLLVTLVGLTVLTGSLTLLGRGCVSVAMRYLNWALTKYYLAKDDVYLNALFAGRHD